MWVTVESQGLGAKGHMTYPQSWREDSGMFYVRDLRSALPEQMLLKQGGSMDGTVGPKPVPFGGKNDEEALALRHGDVPEKGGR